MAFNDPLASYVARIYFNDGNKKSFHSRDFASSRRSKRNRKPELGLLRLRKMIEVTFRGKYKTALIYDRNTNQEISKYVDGIKQF